MIAYRDSLFSLLVDVRKMCIIQCQVIVVGVVVKTLNRPSGNIRTWVMTEK